MTRGLSLAVAAGRVLVPRTVNGTSAAVGGAAPGRPSPCLSDTASTASTLATSEDGLLACAKCSNEDARIFSVTTGKVVSTLEGSSNTGIAEFNSARTRLVTVGGFNARGADIVKVWDPRDGALSVRLIGPRLAAQSCGAPVAFGRSPGPRPRQVRCDH